jgi:hypothetical protein
MMKDSNVFFQAGEAMLLAHEGQRHIAEALLAAVCRGFARLKNWQANMPTTLPPI